MAVLAIFPIWGEVDVTVPRQRSREMRTRASGTATELYVAKIQVLITRLSPHMYQEE